MKLDDCEPALRKRIERQIAQDLARERERRAAIPAPNCECEACIEAAQIIDIADQV